MSGKSKTIFNSDDLKKLKEQFEKAKAEAEKDEGNNNNNNEAPKQTLGSKVLGIIILIALLASVIVVVVLNIDTLLMPKNSVTIIVSDQNGEVIEGLELQLDSGENFYTFEYSETTGTNVTELGVKPGDYSITFVNIPENYSCDKIADDFTMSEGDKIKLEYQCTKE